MVTMVTRDRYAGVPVMARQDTGTTTVNQVGITMVVWLLWLLGGHDDYEDPVGPPWFRWAILFFLIYYFLNKKADTIPEVSFPYFLKHMLNTGEVGGSFC